MSERTFKVEMAGLSEKAALFVMQQSNSWYFKDEFKSMHFLITEEDKSVCSDCGCAEDTCECDEMAEVCLPDE